MHLVAHGDVDDFLAAAEPVLTADEARHNLIFGLCSTIAEVPEAFAEKNFWTVSHDRVVGAAMMTPPFNVIVAQPLHADALAFAARALHEQGPVLPGVTGAIPEVETFASEWLQITGSSKRVRMRQGIYAARTVVTPEGVPGSPREATPDDRELALEWLQGFEDEAMHDDVARPDHGEWFERRLGRTTAGLTLWEDGSAPVSMCGYGGSTPHGIRIGPVYTPPERRRRGYASALTAHVTKRLLDAGRDYCFLYTDLANPTSNKIYMDVGYEFVCESAEYAFDNGSLLA
jgi:ribosomal protein S18 acetylase RimI-like enzyme